MAAIRRRFGRQVILVVRGDSGFCREELMSWIEKQKNVYYCFGLSRNSRLEKMLEKSWWEVARRLDPRLGPEVPESIPAPELEGHARVFADLRYRTLKSWGRERRVVAKAEQLGDKRNPRFIVTNITGREKWAQGRAEFADAQSLYEKFYCARGEMENRIKEQQLDLFADRTSTAFLASNQLRLWFSTFAYWLMSQLRTTALTGTRLARATVGSLRQHLLKIAAQVSVSVRRVQVRLCSACPFADVFATAWRHLRSAPT